MRNFSLAIVLLSLTGCMCRPGMVDCTTNRTYPGFCKPLCGGPCDPFMWLAGDCDTCCCCLYEGGFTPYGGWTCCGDEMVYSPSCVVPPLRWADPAVPMPPSGHMVHVPPGAYCPPGAVPPVPPGPLPESSNATLLAPPAAPVPSDEPLESEPNAFRAPGVLYDARNDQPMQSRR